MSKNNSQPGMLFDHMNSLGFDRIFGRIFAVAVKNTVAHCFCPFGHQLPSPKFDRVVNMVKYRPILLLKIIKHRIIQRIIQWLPDFFSDPRFSIHHFNSVETQCMKFLRLLQQIFRLGSTRLWIIETGKSVTAVGLFNFQPCSQQIICGKSGTQ